MIFVLLYLSYAVAISLALARRGFWSPPAGAQSATEQRFQRLLIIGATGGTGRELVTQALEQGYDVTALVRDPAKLQLTHPRLKTVRGDVLDASAVDAAVRDHDAVLSALGHRRLFVPTTVQSEGTRNVLRAMETHGVRRFICVTSIGLGNSAGRLGLFSTFFFIPVFLAIYFWDKSRQERVVAESSVDWVLVRPGVLTNAPKRGTYRHGVDVGSYLLTGTIGRAEVADFMLQQLRSDQYLRRAAAILS